MLHNNFRCKVKFEYLILAHSRTECQNFLNILSENTYSSLEQWFPTFYVLNPIFVLSKKIVTPHINLLAAGPTWPSIFYFKPLIWCTCNGTVLKLGLSSFSGDFLSSRAHPWLGVCLMLPLNCKFSWPKMWVILLNHTFLSLSIGLIFLLRETMIVKS